MIELYHADRTRSLRVLWVLEELGVPFTLHHLPFPLGRHRRDYLKVNPIGSLPTLVDGDVRMTESMAICQYLVATYGPSPLAVAPSEPGFAAYLQYCFYGEATLTKLVATLFVNVAAAASEPATARMVEATRARLRSCLEPVRDSLRHADTLAGGRVTLADVSVDYALGFALAIGEGADLPPDLLAYHARLGERPAYRRACAVDFRRTAEVSRAVQASP